MPCARPRPPLVLLSGMLATCVVVIDDELDDDEDSGEELEIGSFLNQVPSFAQACPCCQCFSYFIPRLDITIRILLLSL